MAEAPTRVDSWFKFAQTISIIIGIVISVVSYFSARAKEALARQIEAQAPFLKLRQERYVEIGEVVATLVSHAPESDEYASAKTRFRGLYIMQLTMIESPEVATRMFELGDEIDPTLRKLNTKDRKAFDLARALQRSFCGDLCMEKVLERKE